MKIGIIGANGKAGRLIVKEALSRDLDVTAIVRHENKSDAVKAIQKDLFDLSYDDLKAFDVIIDAVGTTSENAAQHITSLKHLADVLKEKPNRLLIIGGAGSLYTNAEHTLKLIDAPDFPDSFKPVASSMSQALDNLRKISDVNWTFISPAADFRYDGARTGSYILAGEEFTVNSKGESILSYADYAIAMIDEAVKGNHIRQRISVVGK
ncbi:NAD(P)-dependent oxidoreductase [Pectinatus haikarae]|uniref:NADH-flavin reductase n=1 Tax=Pectinatus haikarae TaxID=349096 RepID=A0ABT9YA74_9FIRM|nr:NAD(P)H-binding protein [Pectinatus haikarae]MDQ0204538.1 putative NADH-flavin reductase [Pectinatus haikarae]